MQVLAAWECAAECETTCDLFFKSLVCIFVKRLRLIEVTFMLLRFSISQNGDYMLIELAQDI